MQRFGVFAMSAMFALASCASEDPEATGATDPTGVETSTTKANEPDPEPEDSENCLAVSAPMAKAIARGEEKGVGMKAGEIAAVKSPDFAKVYFIAMEFGAAGIDDQVGVWASNSLKPGGGILMSVDGFAQQFTVWPDADGTDAAISPADPSVDAALGCL